MSRQEEPDVLASIACVVHVKAPAVAGICHILQSLNALLDVSVLVSLDRAVVIGSVRLFDRVHQRIILTHPPMDACLLTYRLSQAMQAAVSHMDIAQRIHALYPRCLPVRLLPLAATNGDLPMMQWLVANRTDDFCTPDTVAKNRSAYRCCLRDANTNSVEKNHFHVVQWLLELGYIPVFNDRSPGDAAASAGNLEMVKWVDTQQIPRSFSSIAIDEAASAGHLAIVQYLVANRSEGFSTMARAHAFAHGHDQIHDVLSAHEELHEHEGDEFSLLASEAAVQGRLDLLQSAPNVTANPQ